MRYLTDYVQTDPLRSLCGTYSSPFPRQNANPHHSFIVFTMAEYEIAGDRDGEQQHYNDYGAGEEENYDIDADAAVTQEDAWAVIS